MEEKTKKNNSTKTEWLEKNEVWFRTVFKLFATMMTIIISFFVTVIDYQEYQLKKNQALLSRIEIDKSEREKQPFFSISQKYSDEKKQYIYSILNSGGTVRYSDLHLVPYAFIALYDNNDASSERAQKAFVKLPGLFQYENVTMDQELFSFSDRWIDTALIEEIPIQIDNSQTILVNNYLNHLAYENGLLIEDKWISANLVYHLQVSYYDYKNDEKFEDVWYARSSDMSGNTNGNNKLFIQESMQKWYSDAVDLSYVYEVDSMNMSLEETLVECDKIMKQVGELF